MRKAILLASLLTGLSVAIVSAHAQQPSSTSLLPERLWEAVSFHAPEGAAEFETTEADGTAVARVRVSEAQDNHWQIGLTWTTVAPAAADDVLVLAFEARAEGQRQPPGRINLAFRRTEQPYHHALGEQVTVGSDWREYRIPFPAPVDVEAGDATFRLNLGNQPQSVEIRNLSLRNYGGELSMLALSRMLDLDPTAAGRRAVGEHLHPGLLWQMRVFDELLPPDPDFDPAGAWEQTWRIWTCYGYVDRANRDHGVLRIVRTPGDPFTLQIERVQLNMEGSIHIQRAEVTCALDAIASPLAWEWSSSFLGPNDEELADLAMSHSVTTPPEGAVTADWALFEAVQRLPFDPEAEYRFDVLEGLKLLKRGHRLRYTGPQEVRLGTETRTLHRFFQAGRGQLPYEYWLDEGHRLVLVVSAFRVYVLDPNADEALTEELDRQRASYERNMERWGPETEEDEDE